MKYIRWSVRGIGSNSGWNSLVTGRKVDFGPDMSGFVESRASAYELAEIFHPIIRAGSGGPDYSKEPYDDRCHIDFRGFEPDWLQVKVIVEPEHRAVLERLYSAVLGRDKLICRNDVIWALDPESCPGYEPRGAMMERLLKEERAKVPA
jgi:hypothetical protein